MPLKLDAEQRVDVSAYQDAALAVLGDLTGRSIARDTPLALPDLQPEVEEAGRTVDRVRGRPEYDQFERSRRVLDAQQHALRAQERPRISAFGRAGYGQPGLNPLARTFDEYWTAGVRLEWSPFRWGTPERERQELTV